MISIRWEYWGIWLLVGFWAPGVFAFQFDERFEAEVREQLRETIPSTWETRRDSRAFALEVPAPRGQITDREGRPLAQTRVEYYLALQFPTSAALSDEQVLLYGRGALARASEVLGREIVADDERLLAHYLLRRWVPMNFSERLAGRERALIGELEGAGLRAMPRYLRHYPEESLACHIIGYVGRKAARSKRALISGEPIFPESEGRDGLEVAFDADLRGTSGVMDYIYDSTGTKLREERVRRPRPGHHVVTTLDLDMQRLAERTLSSYCRRGAFVVIDVNNGDILAMASRPTFDLNQFIPYVSTENYALLREDPDIPLFARAFRGLYPPASTFKIATALGILDAGEITPTTRLDGPASLKIGNRYFKNWNRHGEGKMDVAGAIMRSCNTWFYRAALDTGPHPLSDMAHRLGFGRTTGLPLAAVPTGYVPTDESSRDRAGHGLTHGYLANMSIGQGDVSASPLQVARMMAAVGNGGRIPPLRLVKQIQSGTEDKIVRVYPEGAAEPLGLEEGHLDAVVKGMVAVVHSRYGTGGRAAIYHGQMAGKTGTGQWGNPADKKYVAWFAGFVPVDEPRYAFAALYEGRPGEYLSGGKRAAPIVRTFFNSHYASEVAVRD